MIQESSSAAATSQEQSLRNTPAGRHFGEISYAADEQEQTDDLRKRPSVNIPHVPEEHWTSRPSRSTGARRSLS